MKLKLYAVGAIAATILGIAIIEALWAATGPKNLLLVFIGISLCWAFSVELRIARIKKEIALDTEWSRIFTPERRL